MKEINKFTGKGQVDKMLNALFQEGPQKDMIEKAQYRLRSSLKETKENTIFFDNLNHPTIETLYLAMRRNKVIAIDFGVDEIEFITQVEQKFNAPVYFDHDETRAALEQVRNYLNGQHTDFNLPTDISTLTDFQQQVLQATQQIPRGRIATYMDIARKIGNPKAVRAVGQALGRNPIPIVIPCHRVIASNGSLGGYSGGGGIETKAKLLRLEGAMAI